MTICRSRRDRRWAMNMATTALGLVLVACGGSSSTEQDRGTDKTTLTAEASDADGDTLQYQWRVTAGSVENRNARSTVWTLPEGPGLHFAYVIVSDGKGGYVEQQYAVSTDAFETAPPARPLVSHTAPTVTDASTTARLRFVSPDSTLFTPPAGGTAPRSACTAPRSAAPAAGRRGCGLPATHGAWGWRRKSRVLLPPRPRRSRRARKSTSMVAA